MEKKKASTKKRILRNAIVTTLVVAIVFMGALVGYSYFATRAVVYTNDGQTEYFSMGMEINTFFDILDSKTVSAGTNLGIVCTDTTGATLYSSGSTMGTGLYYTSVTEDGVTTNYYVYNPNAEWKSACNPYIISRKAHLQNLYVLQNCGYFAEDIGSGVTERDIPYFLVSTTTGTPVTIDCTDSYVEPIGSEDYPFTGYVGGAFTDGTTTVDGKTSTQSVIYNTTVKTDTDEIDVGLFGHIGYLGTIGTGTTFTGTVSTVRDLLLYDVKVVVEQSTTLSEIAEKIAEHLFSYRTYSNGTITDVSNHLGAEENHHIGILAGHVDLATVEYISVYYSSDDVCAMDVDYTATDTPGNFKSISGIIGYCYEMNSVQANGQVTVGGISADDVEVSGGGIGSGGGEISGTGRGYVTANTIFENYYVEYDDNTNTGTRDNITDSDRKGQIVWEFVRSGQTTTEYGVMIDKVGSNYYLHEDYSVSATVSGNIATVAGNTWTSFIVCDATTSDKTYTAYDGSGLNSFSMLDLKIYDSISIENGSNLCTEYIRDRILWGTASTGMYYFYDGVFTFALSDAEDVIEDTWEDNTPDTITLGNDDDNQWTTDPSGQSNAIVAFGKLVTEQEDLAGGKKIFITYKDSDNVYHLVTLDGNSTYNQGGMNDATTTPSTGLSLVDSETKTELKAALDGGYLTLDSADEDSGVLISEDDLKDQWDSIYVFDIGSASRSMTLDQLRQKYQVTVAWNSSTSDKKMYDDDGEEATETLKTNSQAVQNRYYLVDGKTTDTNYTTGTFPYFLLGNDATEVDESALDTAITTQNSKYYEDDWTTDISDTSNDSPLSTKLTSTMISNSTQISQVEYNLYDDGYFYFDTYNNTRYYYFRLYYVSSTGQVTNYNRKTSVHWLSSGADNCTKQIKALFNSTSTNSDGLMVGTYDGKTLPVLYELNGSYYTSWTRSTWSEDIITGSTSATLTDNVLYMSHTATYNYIVATLSGNGISYTWMGSSTVCTNVQNTGRSVASENNLNMGIYDTSTYKYSDYDIYSCTVNGSTKEGILITKYKLDGYNLKSQTGSGITYTLNTPDGTVSTLSGNGSLTSSVVSSSVVSPVYTLSLGGNSYNLYTVDSKLVVRLAKYAVNGYILTTVLNTSVTHTLNATTTQTGVDVFSMDGSGTPLTISLSNGSTTKNYILYYSSQGSLGIRLSIDGQEGGTYIFSHKNTDNNDGPYKLRILRRAYMLSYYSILVGTDTYVETASNFTGNTTPSVSDDENATITFNSDGSVYISYTVNNTKRYLAYSESGGYFHTANSAGADGTKLYLFTVEGTHDTTISDKIVPVAGTSGGTYSADQYVLYPTSTLTETANDNNETVASTTSTDPTYELLSLQSLYSSKGFRTSEGGVLTSASLYKQFSLREEISWDLQLNLFNGSWDFGSESLNNGTSLVAPIGSNGDEANIPKGSIAFKINDTDAEDGYNVRVIVAIPTSDFYPGQTDSQGESVYELETSEDYYFAIWQTESAGESIIQYFSKDNALEKFELPRSHAYATGADPASSDYITVTMNGNTYRAYLGGDQILVAYTFTVTEAGVYVLGATNGPMEIVYFSADSVASGGKDGIVNFRMGTIDFVYDNGVNTVSSEGVVTNISTGTKILTIRDADPESDGVLDYDSYYYPTLSLLYSDNNGDLVPAVTGDTDLTDGFPNINDFAIYVRRLRVQTTDGTNNSSELAWQAKGGTGKTGGVVDAVYWTFSRYAINADEITRRDNEVR